MRLVWAFIFLGGFLAALIGLFFLWKPLFPKSKQWIFTIAWFVLPLLWLGLAFLGNMFSTKLQTFATNLGFIWFGSIWIAGLIALMGWLAFSVFSVEHKTDSTFLAERRTLLRQLAGVAAAIPFSTMWYGILRTANDFQIQTLNLKFTRLPKAFHGFRIVQISDIHTGSVWNANTFAKAVQLILDQKPDMVVFTGDLVNNETSEAYPFLEILSQIKAQWGVFSILGNHDYGDYKNWANPADKAANFEAMLQMHKKLGWELLRNEHRLIEKDGDLMALAGVENWGAKLHFKRYGNLNKTLEGIGGDQFTLLLSHDPSHWEAEILHAKKKVDLTLSGHTHGFQFGVEVPGFRWSPAQYIYPQWAGLYTKNQKALYVNRGLGCIGYSGRVGIQPEITVFNLLQE